MVKKPPDARVAEADDEEGKQKLQTQYHGAVDPTQLLQRPTLRADERIAAG